ncbi:hypothetical protein LCGC14_1063330 [marine sediment metagenome]|uniref:PEGA domain-containing protein n=1 Tax=marine sediment metagenome TaxID=412755 RepID=A0A0F9MKJ2_9ZZZZ
MLRINVKEKVTEKPIQFVLVRIENMVESYIDDTDINGVAEFKGIRDNKYNIKIRSKNYRPFTEKMYLSRNSIINIKLHKAFD